MTGIFYKGTRFLSRGVSRSILPGLDESIITFGFDDCPASAIETALPMLESEGWKATIYVACGLCETENHLGRHMSLSDVKDVHDRGHEIADHTFSHMSSNDVRLSDYIADIERNQNALKDLGLPKSRHFAYPYGHVSPGLKRVLREKFKTLRGVKTSNNTSQDANLLNAVRLYSGPDLEAALQQIENAESAPQWLNLYTHDVRENPSDFGCTPDDFKKIVSKVKATGLPVMNVDAAYRIIDERRLSS
jgi:peptidoglycan/xylan/chitin deacetylase (PgdA/CDA1 family)